MPNPVFILQVRVISTPHPVILAFYHLLHRLCGLTDNLRNTVFVRDSDATFSYNKLTTSLEKSTMSLTDETSPVEQLFLDRSIHDVLTKKWPAVEPWGTIYVDAIREQRYGDAVWARYHIEGNVENGVIISPSPSDNMPVLDSIREDAEEAKMNEPEFYAKTLQSFAKTSPSDGHPEVIQIIIEAGKA